MKMHLRESKTRVDGKIYPPVTLKYLLVQKLIETPESPYIFYYDVLEEILFQTPGHFISADHFDLSVDLSKLILQWYS